MDFKKLIYISLATLALSAFASSGAIASIITIDQTGPAGGTVSYGGNGGTLSGSNIRFDEITYDGQSLTCKGCVLDFETGNNTGEEPNMWTFAGGGDFTLTGTVVDGTSTIINSGTILSGAFTAEFTGPTLTKITNNSANFTGAGTDTKSQLLLDYFGIDDDTQFTFANSEIDIGEATFGDNGSFSGTPNNADITNTPVAAVPEPAELGLLGLGLALIIGSVLYRRKNGADLG